MTLYNNIIDSIQPLDLIFFRGNDFVSDTISILQQIKLGSGEFTHVGMVVNNELLPTITQLKSGKLYVLESTISIPYPGSGPMTPDIVSGEGIFGVQIRELEDVIRTYTITEGAVLAWTKLKHNPFFSNKQFVINMVETIYNKVKNKGYEINCFELFGSLFSCVRPIRDNLITITIEDHKILITKNDGSQMYFCSELIGLIYKSISILPDYIDERNIVPMDLLGYDQDYHIDIVEKPIYIKMS